MPDIEIFTQRMIDGAQLVGIAFDGAVKEIPRLDFYLKELEERVSETRRACREVMCAHQQKLVDSMFVGVPADTDRGDLPRNLETKGHN